MQIDQPTSSDKPGKDWLDVQRTQLQRLISSILIRDGFDERSLVVARSIETLLKEQPGTIHPPRESSIPLFTNVQEKAGGLSFRWVAGLALKLFQDTEADLPAKIRASLGHLSGDSISYMNRPIHRASKEIIAMSQKVQRAGDVSLLSAGQALWFAGRLLSTSAPPADQFKANECAFCHRHTLSRTTCHVHRTQGRYTVPLQQRENFESWVQHENARLESYFVENSKDLHALMGADADEALKALLSACEALCTSQAFATLKSASVAAGGLKAGLAAIASAWHQLPQVDDRDGISAVEQSTLPVAAELMSHLLRYDAFTRMGGDIERRKRNLITDNADVAKIMTLRREGKSQAEAAEMMSISVTQLRRIEREQIGEQDLRLKKVEVQAPVKVPRKSSSKKTGRSGTDDVPAKKRAARAAAGKRPDLKAAKPKERVKTSNRAAKSA